MPSALGVGRSGRGSLRWGEGDGAAEGFELADQVAGLALSVDVMVVPVRAEVTEAGGAAGEQVEDDDQDGAGDRGEGLALASPPGGDLIQPGHRGQDHRVRAGAGLRAGDPVSVRAPGGGDLADQLGDPVRQRINLPGQGAGLVQQEAGRLAVVRLLSRVMTWICWQRG